MYITICEIDRQPKFYAWDRVLRAGALGWSWAMGQGGRWEGGSGWGTHVHSLLIHANVWQKPPQYCSGFAIHWHESAMGVPVSPILNNPHQLPPHTIPQGHPSAPALSTLSHASNLDWRSISHMVIYIFQCYSLKSSHLHLLPQSPKVCSLHLCLFCCLAYKVIITIFLNSIYMH